MSNATHQTCRCMLVLKSLKTCSLKPLFGATPDTSYDFEGRIFSNSSQESNRVSTGPVRSCTSHAHRTRTCLAKNRAPFVYRLTRLVPRPGAQRTRSMRAKQQHQEHDLVSSQACQHSNVFTRHVSSKLAISKVFFTNIFTCSPMCQQA